MYAVGPYYATGFKPISLWADTEHVRAWPGGTGDAKVKNLCRKMLNGCLQRDLSSHKLLLSMYIVVTTAPQ
jgi:hypothetical protein